MPTTLPAKKMTKAEAVALTERIREAAESTWDLLVEAHRSRVWEVLGYGDWSGYCEREFGMTDRNARYLLGRWEVLNELEKAAGVDLPPETVTSRELPAVKPVLPEVAERVQTAVRGKPKETRPAIVAAVVDEVAAERKPFPAQTAKPNQIKPESTGPAETSGGEPTQAERFAALIPRVVKLSIEDVAAAIPSADRPATVKALYRFAEGLMTFVQRGSGYQDAAAARMESEAQGKCAHPVGRRLGDHCMACGKRIR